MIGEFEIPVWVDDCEVWYPLSTISRVFYGRDGVSKQNREQIKQYCKKVNIIYSSYYGYNSSTETIVVNKEGLCIWINNKRPKRMNVEQKLNHNMLCRYFNLECISEKVSYVNILPDEEIDKYNEFAKELRKSIKGEYSEYALCNKCDVYYPVHMSFFLKNPINKNGHDTSKCIRCKLGNFKGEMRNDTLNEVEDIEFEIDKIKYMVNKNGMVYNEWYDNNNNFKNLLYELKENKTFTIENFDSDYYILTLKNMGVSRVSVNHTDAVWMLFGIDYYLKPYKYGRRLYPIRDVDFNFQKSIFNNYLYDKNITIDNYEKFNYSLIINSCGLSDYVKYTCDNGAKTDLDFAEMYNDYKIPLYKFKVNPKRYWDKLENRTKLLKQFIENEIECDNLDKLPLYLTKNFMQKRCRMAYNILRNKYNSQLYEWVNELYPDKFQPQEWNIWYRRDEFDSLEEERVHNILKDKFGRSLFYNSGDSSNRIKLGDTQPDWFVFNDKPIIVEYFGVYVKNRSNNKMISDYVARTDKKIEYYDSLDSYSKLYIYPEDLKNNYIGLMEKLRDF